MHTRALAKPQELSNTAWAYAQLSFLHLPLMDAIAAASIAKITQCLSQDHSNLAWAFATLHLPNAPLCDSIAAAALRTIRQFERQHLVNTAWSFATLRFEHPPLMKAISAAALPKLADIPPHGLASLAWALARLACADAPLLDAIAAQAMRLLDSRAPRLAGRNVGMLLWAFGRTGGLPHVWALLEASRTAGQHLDGLSLGGVVQACRELSLHHSEVRLMQQHLSRGAMGAVALDACALLLAEVGAAGEALELLRAGADAGLFGQVSSRVWAACDGGSLPVEPLEGLEVELGEPYSKELRLLAHVLRTAVPGDVDSVCAAVETFGEEKLPGTSHWLKIAGGTKAGLLVTCARRAPRDGFVLEVGTYCGYSAARLAAARASGRPPRGPLVVTLEVDAAHAIVARSLLAFAGLAHRVEVLTGHSEDVLPWLVRRMKDRVPPGAFVDMVFLDQRGSRYEADLAVLQQAGALSPGAVVVADNVLKPGAPLFLWRVTHGAGYATEVFSMTEFAMSGVEDWMTVSVYQPDSHQAAVRDPPIELRMLDWKAQQMRARTHRPDHGGSGVGFAEWAEFASEMRRGFAAAGFEAEPL
uniref:catechol O-methyltransferase n=1 Tax=Alexandrium monilatum TaxID=311494 RepID=A0A7S4RAM3_9DINO